MEQSSNRTYRLRGSRITGPQQSALDKYWGTYGHEYSTELLNITSLFPTAEQVVLEIGFGMGEATALIGRDFPETGFLAVEVHKPGIGKLMARIEELELRNIRIIEGDAHPILKTMIPDNSVDGIHLFFPDPWPKQREQSRRLLRPEVVAQLAEVLKPGGCIRLATDIEDYWRKSSGIIAASGFFAPPIVGRPEWRIETVFEKRGNAAGLPAVDMSFERL